MTSEIGPPPDSDRDIGRTHYYGDDCNPPHTPPPCPRCSGPTDPEWYCSEGYCPECCVATDEGRRHAATWLRQVEPDRWVITDRD